MEHAAWHGFEIRLIDRLLRKPYAEGVVAATAAASIVILLLMFGGAYPDFQRLMHSVRNLLPLLGLFALVFAIGGWWAVRTWKRLWRRGRTPREKIQYDYGVRTFGLVTLVALLLAVTWLGWMSDSGEIFGPMMIGGALAGLFFGTPVSLHLGYFWGKAFADMVAAEDDPAAKPRDPPPVT